MGFSEVSTCNDCYQAYVCDKYGKPLSANAAVEGGDSTSGFFPDCFYFCCREGVKAAKDALREARGQRLAGLIYPLQQHISLS